MNKPHVHAETIKAWADGAQIQVLDEGGWADTPFPLWMVGKKYRVKPEDTVLLGWVTHSGRTSGFTDWSGSRDNLKLTFDGGTGKLKSAEVIK